jgi:hypothetical protein
MQPTNAQESNLMGGVKDQPEPVSWISRGSVKDQVTPECPASPEHDKIACPRQESNLRLAV